MKKILIFGSGCHAKVVFSEIVKLKKYTILGFVDDYSPKGKIIIKYDNKNFLNLGKIKDITNNKDLCGIIGVGSSVLRKKIFMEIKTKFKNFKYEAIISKDSIIDKDVSIGDNFSIDHFSSIDHSCSIGNNVNIGKNVSISNSAIYCTKNITISDNVMIGSGTRIWDTDFHSLNYQDRVFGKDIKRSEAVKIKEGAFIGASVTILKGVTIGKQSIIGACSLVTKDVGDFEVWAGNPAKKIK